MSRYGWRNETPRSRHQTIERESHFPSARREGPADGRPNSHSHSSCKKGKSGLPRRALNTSRRVLGRWPKALYSRHQPGGMPGLGGQLREIFLRVGRDLIAVKPISAEEGVQFDQLGMFGEGAPELEIGSISEAVVEPAPRRAPEIGAPEAAILGYPIHAPAQILDSIQAPANEFTGIGGRKFIESRARSPGIEGIGDSRDPTRRGILAEGLRHGLERLG